jgi:hypothetical protein
MLSKLTKYYNYYTNPDAEISETEDSFAIFADFEGVPGATVITISMLCFLHFRYPILSEGLSLIANICTSLPPFFAFFVFCFGIIAGFFVVTILPYILLHAYIRFLYWYILGFFQKFEKSLHWRQYIDCQLVGWSKMVNSLFGKQYLWQNYEISIELHTPESEEHFENIFKIYFQNLHKKYYATYGYDTRKPWKFDPNTGIISGSLNTEYLSVFHNLLKYDLTKSTIEVKRIVFIPNDEPYFVRMAQSDNSCGG